MEIERVGAFAGPIIQRQGRRYQRPPGFMRREHTGCSDVDKKLYDVGQAADGGVVGDAVMVVELKTVMKMVRIGK